MPKFGKTSLKKRETLHPDLQKVLDIAITRYDFSIICGSRSDEEQQIAYDKGNSKAKPGESKHNDGFTHIILKPNKGPISLAADGRPYPIDENDKKVINGVPILEVRYAKLVGFIIGIGEAMGITIRGGLDWDDDGSCNKNYKDPFMDYAHFELI